MSIFNTHHQITIAVLITASLITVILSSFNKLLRLSQPTNNLSESGITNFYEPQPNTSNNEPGWHYTINSDTLNEIYEYSATKPSDIFRIIILGSSWAFGHLVETKNNYSELLEDRLNTNLNCSTFKKIEVINLSVYGYDIQYMVERFKRRGVKYDANLVIILTKDDDFVKALDLIKQKLDNYSSDTGKKPGFQENGKFVDELRDVRKEIVQEAHNKFGKDQILNYQFSALNELSETHRNKLLFLMYSVTPEERKFIENLAKNREVTYFYEKSELGENEKNYYGSPNEKGHESFAEDLFEFIVNNRIIPC